ncbi:MAG: hypothetical protein ABSG07_20130 [Terriglobales bacterium]
MPSRDGTVEAAPVRRILSVSSDQRWQLLSEPLLLRRVHIRVGAARIQSAIFHKPCDRTLATIAGRVTALK